jgi:hypothetical protein
VTEVSADVVQALAQREEKRTIQSHDRIRSHRVTRGDLRIISGLSHLSADARIGLVLAVDSHNEFTEVLLVHSATELACETDAVVPKATSSAPYDLVVQTDLRAVVWTWQLGAAVGWLDERTLAAISSISAGAPPGSPTLAGPAAAATVYSGTHLAGPTDGRWAFKEEEGDALRRLADDCTTALLDRGLVWRVDPGLLQPEWLDHADSPLDLLNELLHWAMTRTLTVADEDLDLLAESGALSVDAWRALGDMGLDVWTGLQEIFLGAASGAYVAGASGHRLVTAGHLRRGDENEAEAVHFLCRRESIR